MAEPAGMADTTDDRLPMLAGRLGEARDILRRILARSRPASRAGPELGVQDVDDQQKVGRPRLGAGFEVRLDRVHHLPCLA